MRVVLVVCLVFVILDLNKVRVYGVRVERQGNECVDGSGLGNNLKCPRLRTSAIVLRVREASVSHLLVLELNQIPVVLDDLVALIFARLEKLGQSKPLSGHLVAVIGVDTKEVLACRRTHVSRGGTSEQLIVVYAVGGIALNSADCRFAGIKGNDVVDQGLALGAELDRFRRVGRVVLRCRGLANFELFSWLARHGCGLCAKYGYGTDKRSLRKACQCFMQDGTNV